MNSRRWLGLELCHGISLTDGKPICFPSMLELDQDFMSYKGKIFLLLCFPHKAKDIYKTLGKHRVGKGPELGFARGTELKG